VTSVFNLFWATENTEKKTLGAQEGPANWWYRAAEPQCQIEDSRFKTVGSRDLPKTTTSCNPVLQEEFHKWTFPSDPLFP
jgi:hypothetical protein